jgi:threonine dehydratase
MACKSCCTGAETGLAEQHAQRLALSTGARYVSPYNDADVIAGQGTIGLELLDQARRSTMSSSPWAAAG